MVLRCVWVRRGRVSALISLAGLSASVLVAVSSPADAARRKTKRGGYAPPYAAMVVDARTGRTLHAQNEDALRHPASITKVMTLYLLFEQLERGKVSLNTPLRVSANAARQPPSKLGVDPGETIEVEDAIKALVTKSANDIAVVVAENLAGTEEAFAEQMTRKAHALGMRRTVYRNASGLPDAEQVTTARDLTVLARAIQERFPKYYRYFQTRVFEFAGAAHRNHNNLLGRVEGVDGIKTGFTHASGFNLMTNAKTADRHIVAIVLGGRSASSRDQAVAALVRSNLPRAYAGARPAPAIAERPRSGDVPSPPVREVEATATATAAVAARPASATPLDLNPLRPVVASAANAAATMTPNALTGRPHSPPMPEAAQAYAPVAAAAGLPPLPPTHPMAVSSSGKIQARLAALEPVAVKTDVTPVPLPEPRPKAESLEASRLTDVPEPPRRAVEPRGGSAIADARRGTNHTEGRREAPRPTALTSWIIQLGATDDETKAKAILDDAKSRAGRALVKALPFTEKIVREGATLYRARFSGFDEADRAQEACKFLKRSGFNCFASRS
jgi:D-alanyl-D-alanine carboxypeptidase